MKFFINYYNSIINKPFTKFSTNLFFLKNIQFFNYSNLNYLHMFNNIFRKFSTNLIKFNLIFYKNFIVYFIITNFILQLVLIFIFL